MGFDLMKNIEIKINKNNRMVDLNKTIIGNDGENLQGKLIFSFADEFVDGQARLDYSINNNKYFIALEKVGETYEVPILSVITKKGQINMQLVITEGIDENEIPIFKSNIFYLTCNASINAEVEDEQEYISFIDIANTKLNQVDNIDVDIENSIITITKKDGTVKTENVRGEKGDKGDAGSIKIIPVTEFPTENIDESAIYVIPNDKSTSEIDRYKEYIYVDGDWEPFGGGVLNVDLKDYVKTETLEDYVKNETLEDYVTNEALNNTLENALYKDNTTPYEVTNDYNPTNKKYVDDVVKTKQNTLIAGENITIENNVISAVSGSSGSGIAELSGTINGWELDEGLYKLIKGTLFKYTNNSSITANSNCILYIEESSAYTGTRKYILPQLFSDGYVINYGDANKNFGKSNWLTLRDIATKEDITVLSNRITALENATK